MNREEAITYLEWMKDLAEDSETPEQKDTMLKTINKAIEALEQEPYEDAISRQAVLGYIGRLFNQGTGKKKSFKFIQKYVKQLPSVNLQEPKPGHWIDNHNNTISCDRCHTWFNKDDRYGYMHYCPYCNAKMESEE